jgi:hypothetical protein
MLTEYDKAIAAFLASAVQMLVAFKIGIPGVSPESLLSMIPFVTGIVTWIIPNKSGAK